MGAKVATFEQCYNAEKRRRLLTSIERSDRSALGMLDNLLTTYDNLKQVAKPFVHRCFDNLTTFYKKIIV